MGDEYAGHDSFERYFVNATTKAHALDALVLHSCMIAIVSRDAHLNSDNNDGGQNWKVPGFLDQQLLLARNMLDVASTSPYPLPLWCGECGPHNGGGVANVTGLLLWSFSLLTCADRFISSFWFADALGTMAQIGLKQFGRQTLIGGNYGLIHQDTYMPNPDYFTAVLWTRLMGTKVFSTSTPVAYNDTARVYVHCSKSGPTGSVVAVFINIGPSDLAFTLKGVEGDLTSYDLYSVSAESLTSSVVFLNGKALNMDGDNVPALDPVKMTSSEVHVAAQTYAFAVFPGSKSGQC